MFYSVLVSRAATYGFAPFAACALVILGVSDAISFAKTYSFPGTGYYIGAAISVPQSLTCFAHIDYVRSAVLLLY